MSERQPHDRWTTRQRWWGEVAGAAALTAADGIVFTLMLFHLMSTFRHHAGASQSTYYAFQVGSDVGTPLLGWVWFLALLNGAALTAYPRTRAFGVGILLVAALVAGAVLAWGGLMLLTFSWG